MDKATYHLVLYFFFVIFKYLELHVIFNHSNLGYLINPTVRNKLCIWICIIYPFKLMNNIILSNLTFSNNSSTYSITIIRTNSILTPTETHTNDLIQQSLLLITRCWPNSIHECILLMKIKTWYIFRPFDLRYVFNNCNITILIKNAI